MLQEFNGELGQSCVLTHFQGLGRLGREFGAQSASPDSARLRKLVHASRNAQRKGDEATCPAEGELLMVHTGFDRTSKDVESLFRPSTARKDGPLEAELKELMTVFTDKSIRSCKKKVPGSYTTRSQACLISAVPFSIRKPARNLVATTARVLRCASPAAGRAFVPLQD